MEFSFDAERFVSYYTSNGWRVGRNPMKDWKAACRSWARNGYGNGPKAAAPRIAQTDYSQRDYEERPLGELPDWLVEEMEQEDREKAAFLEAHGIPDTQENRERLIRSQGVWMLKAEGVGA